MTPAFAELLAAEDLRGHPAEARRAAVLARVLESVEVNPWTGCWTWTGQTSGHGRGGGYPRMKLDGRTVAVHRVLACHFFGYLHAGRQLDHTCRRRLCVNPAHLEPVTNRENARRRDAANAGVA